MSVFWTCHSFESNLWIKGKFAKYLKGSLVMNGSLNYFVREIPPKQSGERHGFHDSCIEINHLYNLQFSRRMVSLCHFGGLLL